MNLQRSSNVCTGMPWPYKATAKTPASTRPPAAPRPTIHTDPAGPRMSSRRTRVGIARPPIPTLLGLECRHVRPGSASHGRERRAPRRPAHSRPGQLRPHAGLHRPQRAAASQRLAVPPLSGGPAASARILIVPAPRLISRAESIRGRSMVNWSGYNNNSNKIILIHICNIYLYVTPSFQRRLRQEQPSERPRRAL